VPSRSPHLNADDHVAVALTRTTHRRKPLGCRLIAPPASRLAQNRLAILLEGWSSTVKRINFSMAGKYFRR
jgi:hypothetical protein